MRIAFDIDHVLFDFAAAVRHHHGEQYPKCLTVEPTQWAMAAEWEIPEEEWRRIVEDREGAGELYRSLEFMITDNVRLVRTCLNAGDAVHIVTARPPHLAGVTLTWLEAAGIDVAQLAGVHFSNHGEKHLIDVDVLVDDSYDECAAFVNNGNDLRRAIMPARPWNQVWPMNDRESPLGVIRKEDVYLCEMIGEVAVLLERRGSAEKAPDDPRAAILDEAKQLVTADRNLTHGAPEDNFTNIAALWAPYLNVMVAEGREVDALDVAALMTLFKMGRLAGNRHNRDNYADAIGYLACGWRISELERNPQ